MRILFLRLSILCPFIAGLAICAAQTMPSTQPTTNPVALNWDQAKDHVGETASVTGSVVGTHSFDDGSFVLNVGKNFPDPGRFTVYVPGDQQETGKSADSYQGKTVTATGPIQLYRNVPEIRCGTKDIQAVATTEPTTTP